MDASEDQEAIEPVEPADEWLRILVGEINSDPRNRLSVTVLVGGQFLSGSMVPGRRWAEGVAEDLRAAAPDLETVAEAFEQFGQLVYPLAGEQDKAEDPDVPRLNLFLHLEDVVTIAPNGRATSWSQGRLRLRLSSVDGWMLGAVGPDGG